MTSALRVEEAEESAHAPTAPHDVLTQASGVSYLSLLLFYLPLAFSGLMMTLDLPIVNGVLNRFPNPDNSVAALRVAFSMALVYEASHISMIDISTAMSSPSRSMSGSCQLVMSSVYWSVLNAEPPAAMSG